MTSRRAFLASSLATSMALAAAGCRPMRAAIPRFSADPFSLGVASGYPTPCSVVLWTRLAPSPFEPGGGLPPQPIPVQWEVAAHAALSAARAQLPQQAQQTHA